jgi:mannose-6-phosphate isomerase-like protein (cupin superfamily)
MNFNPSETYTHLTAEGSAELIPGGEGFWAMPETEIQRFGRGWLVTEFECASDWSNWEMHPEADEFVYLVAGEAALLLELPGGLREVPLVAGKAVVVPRGTWHTTKVSQPARMLFVTMGRGTQHRAA